MKLLGQKLNHIVTALVAVATVYMLVYGNYLDRGNIAEAESTYVETEGIPNTIAVLPFVNLSSEPQQEYFVDGLSEEILNQLASIPELLVVSRTASFAFKDTNKTLQEIAGALEVEYLLEGSVRKVGSSLRVTAQLSRPEDGSHPWSKTYDREFNDIFAVQSEIAKDIADELKVTLGIEKPNVNVKQT